MFSWLLLIPILEFAYVDSAYDDFRYPDYTTEITVGAEAVAFDTVYVKGGVVNYQTYDALDTWKPFRAVYKFEAGLRFKGIEAGYYHECSHRVMSSEYVPHFSGGMTKFFIRYGGRL